LKDFSKVYLQEVMEKYVEIDENRRRCKKGWAEGEGEGGEWRG
jgi:hypothetical protein